MAKIISLVCLTLLVVTPAVGAELVPTPSQRFSTEDSSANPFGPLLPRGRATDLGGIQAVCGGPDAPARAETRWDTFPLRLEFTGPAGSPVAFAHVSVTDIRGQGLLSVRCPGAWLLLGLPAGEFKALVGTPGSADQSIGFVVPPSGQKTLVVRFPGPASL